MSQNCAVLLGTVSGRVLGEKTRMYFRGLVVFIKTTVSAVCVAQKEFIVYNADRYK